MMYTQSLGHLYELPSGRALHLPGRRGRLIVESGRLWLTRGARDELITPGRAVCLGPGDVAVVEPWDASGASFRWRAESGVLMRALRTALGTGFLAAAAGLRALAGASAALARRAEGRAAS